MDQEERQCGRHGRQDRERRQDPRPGTRKRHPTAPADSAVRDGCPGRSRRRVAHVRLNAHLGRSGQEGMPSLSPRRARMNRCSVIAGTVVGIIIGIIVRVVGSI